MADPALSLYYPFAQTESLASSLGRGPTLTIARAGPAPYADRFGVLRMAAANEPRFDHDPLTGRSLGLLIEGEREFICLRSEDLGTLWTILNGTVTTKNTLAPDGSTNADKLRGTGGGSGEVQARQDMTFATSTAHVASLFANRNLSPWCRLAILNLGSLDVQAYFDLSNGVLGATTGANNTSEFIEDWGNGWFRCGIVFTSDASDTTGTYAINLADGDGDVIVTLDSTSSAFFWGMDAGAGTKPTGYMRTVGSPVMRYADDVQADIVGENNPTAGTFYAKYVAHDLQNPRMIFAVDNGVSSTNAHQLFAFDAATVRYLVKSGGSSVAQLDNAAANDTMHQSALVYALNDYEHYLDGARSGTGDQAGALPVGADILHLGSRAAGDYANIHLEEFRYYNERKSNQRAADLSLGLVSESGHLAMHGLSYHDANHNWFFMK